MAQQIHKFYPGNNSYPSFVSSGSGAYIRYQVFDANIDVNFEINITTTICNSIIIYKII